MSRIIKILVVYYSRSGKTRNIASIIAKELEAETEEIVDHKNRKGLLGFISSGNEAYLQRVIPIEKLKKDPAGYDLIIIGTPVWAGYLSSPVHSFLREYKEKIAKFAFFITCMGSDPGRILLNVEHIMSKKPVVVMNINHRAFKKQYQLKMIDEFVSSIKQNIKD